ncbi:MAG: NUDIX hydrolase [Anaerolineales bacterium]|nr:NUDIX hydrolase [Anaerolineales bacterium]
MTEADIPALGERPAVSVDVVIFSVRAYDLQALLLRRPTPPFRGRWALPGGFVRPSEALDDAARRELQAQTDVHDVYLEQLYTFGAPRRDPRGRVVSVAYFALIASEVAIRAGSPEVELSWQSIYNLPELAFDHADILRYALQRLRYKLEYTSVGFELLPNEFTLTELQTAYEIVLGKELDKRNFRRRMLEAGILTETARYRESEGQGRPARLYRYKKNAVHEVKARRLFP